MISNAGIVYLATFFTTLITRGALREELNRTPVLSMARISITASPAVSGPLESIKVNFTNLVAF